jgi:hypothetical protein
VFIAAALVVATGVPVALAADPNAAADAELQRQAAAEQSRLEHRAERKLTQRARDNVQLRPKSHPLDPRWQKAVEDARRPDFSSLIGSRTIALVVGSAWLALLYRRWAARRRRRGIRT